VCKHEEKPSNWPAFLLLHIIFTANLPACSRYCMISSCKLDDSAITDGVVFYLYLQFNFTRSPPNKTCEVQITSVKTRSLYVAFLFLCIPKTGIGFNCHMFNRRVPRGSCSRLIQDRSVTGIHWEQHHGEPSQLGRLDMEVSHNSILLVLVVAVLCAKQLFT
jgi:hypothetical protein